VPREFPRLNPRDLIRTTLLNGHSEAVEDLHALDAPWGGLLFGQPTTGHQPVYGFLAQLSAVDASTPKKYSWVRLVDVDTAGNWSYPSATIDGGPGSVGNLYPAYPYDPAAAPPVGSVVWLEPSTNGECFHFFWQPFSGTIPGSPTFSGTPVFAGGFTVTGGTTTVSGGTVVISGTTALNWTSTGDFTFSAGGMVFGQTANPTIRPAGYLILPWITAAQVPTYVGDPGEVLCSGKYQYQSDGTDWWVYVPWDVPDLPLADGSLPYLQSGAITELPVGSTGDVLTVVGGVPAWQAPAGGLAVAVALGGTPVLSARPTWHRVPVTHADLATGATTNTVTLLSLPAQGYLHSAVVKHSAAFTGGAIGTYTLSAGLTGSLSKYVSGFSVTGAPSGTNFRRDGGTAPAPDLIDFAAATPLKLTAACSGANLSAATAGAADVYLLLSALA
jgi:hypothetical protein